MLPEIIEKNTESNQEINSQQALTTYISYLKEIKSNRFGAENLTELSASAKKAIDYSNNWFKESIFWESTEKLKTITRITLDNFKQYFQEKLSLSDSEEILNNLGSLGDFYQNIPNPPSQEALISTMQEYSNYLSKLVFLLENKDLDQRKSCKKALDSLAIFPGKLNEVTFACLPGSSQRIREQSMALDAITYATQAVKNSLLTKTSQLAPQIYNGNQVHLESCLLFMLHIDQQELSKIDCFYSTPIKDIKLFEALSFVSNFSKEFDEELDKIVDNLYENYCQIPLTLNPSDNYLRNVFVEKLNLSISTSLPNAISIHDIFEVNDETYELNLKSKVDFRKLILTKIKNSQHESRDFLREFSMFESLFYKDRDAEYLDVKKIDNLLSLFASSENKSEKQREIDAVIGIKTLHLLSEKFKNSNILFLACFFEDFEQKIGQKFEDFFYESTTNSTPKKIKPEYEKYKNMIESTINLYQSDLRKYYKLDTVLNIRLLDFHKKIYRIGNISDQENKDLEKKELLKALMSEPNFSMNLRSPKSNVLHYSGQFFEKNTIKFILKNISEEIFSYLIENKLDVDDVHDSLKNLNPLQIATRNKDQEMLSFFLDLKFNHRNQASSQPKFEVDDKFEFIRNNKLLSMSLKNNDLATFKFLLKQFEGVDMINKIKTGIENQDEEILEILKLVTQKGKDSFFQVLNLEPPLSDCIFKKLTKNALENDNPTILDILGVVDISEHLTEINYKSENTIKKFFDDDFIKKNFEFVRKITRESIQNGNTETSKYLIENSDVLNSFNALTLQQFLVTSIIKNNIEISKLIIKQILELPKQSVSCVDYFSQIGSCNLNQKIRVDSNGIIAKPLNSEGSTYSYLGLACKYKQIDIAKFLIEKGAKISDDCFKTAIKTKDVNILNFLISEEMTRSGKTKLEVLKEKSAVIFNKFSRNFDLEILKSLFENLNDSEKKELLNFNIKEKFFCLSTTVFEKILDSARVLPIIYSPIELSAFIDNLRTIKDSRIPAITPIALSANLALPQETRRL